MTLSITQVVLICFGFFMVGGWVGIGLMCLMFAAKSGDNANNNKKENNNV